MAKVRKEAVLMREKNKQLEHNITRLREEAATEIANVKKWASEQEEALGQELNERIERKSEEQNQQMIAKINENNKLKYELSNRTNQIAHLEEEIANL